MDTGYLIEVMSLTLRWLHLIVGIAWIGSSFYFIWLDNSIRPPEDEDLKEKGVLGELWAMHAGGFYNPQKYIVAPKILPKKLHWFFWPSYSTFLTGFLLISTLYYLQASQYMVDTTKANLTPGATVIIGLSTLVGGWLVYDILARLLIDKSQLVFAFAYGLFVTAVSYGLNHVLSGRAAYIHVGAMIASSMTANVFFIIIPAQRIIVGAMKRGEVPDSKPGKGAKQRSIHNNYLTLPVLFSMISNHYAFTYNHPQAWLVLILIMIGSVLIRHYFNLRHKQVYKLRYPISGGAIILGVFIWIAPHIETKSNWKGPPVTITQVQTIVSQRCLDCHGSHPTRLAAPAAGVVLESSEQIIAQSRRMYNQVCILKAMPLGNVTNITQDERDMLADWVINGAKNDPTTQPTTHPTTPPTTQTVLK